MDTKVSAQFWGAIAPGESMRRVLSAMDGVESFAYSIWRTPEGVRWEDVDTTRWPIEYLQSAGSADAMTVEMRRLEDGEPRQYAVGRGETTGSHPDVVIPFGTTGGKVTLFAVEVFVADEAQQIYEYYYEHNTVPDQYSLRLLDLTYPKPETN